MLQFIKIYIKKFGKNSWFLVQIKQNKSGNTKKIPLKAVIFNPKRKRVKLGGGVKGGTNRL